ncbi:LSM domain protein, partial [Ostertagia ostertagi]
MVGKHDVLRYTIPGGKYCYVFLFKRSNHNHDVYRCRDCKRKGALVTVKVVGDDFLSDPCDEPHICLPTDSLRDKVERLVYKACYAKIGTIYADLTPATWLLPHHVEPVALKSQAQPPRFTLPGALCVRCKSTRAIRPHHLNVVRGIELRPDQSCLNLPRVDIRVNQDEDMGMEMPQHGHQRSALPLSLLRTAQNHPMLIELKNGETYNGHLQSCDSWMNIHLRDVIFTSKVSSMF